MPRRRPPGPSPALLGLNEVLKVRRDMLAYYAGLHATYEAIELIDRTTRDIVAERRAERIPQHAYFPFGAGPRVCIGRQFALVELQLVAATLLQALSVRALPGAPAAGLHARLSLRPEGGLRLRWTPRN